MSTIPDIITSLQHAHTQVESLILGSQARSEQLDEAGETLAEQYGGDVGVMVAVSCAKGAELDVARQLDKVANSLLETIGHLQSTISPP